MRLLLICLLALPAAAPSQWRAGVAVEKITPREPVWMSGYGNRETPSQGVAQDLFAKALALEDPTGGQVVIVTTDLIGLSRESSERIAAVVAERRGLSRDRLLLTSSHTHTGPAIAKNLPLMRPPTPELARRTEEYTAWLEARVVAAVEGALDDLAPAELFYHVGRAGFALNRRERRPDGTVRIGENPDGPVDHDVPVLRVRSEGRLRAALFSYAAHNTTLTGEHMEFHGDYAGYAQEFFEAEHPDAVALFMMGCGGDANPSPRGTIEAAERNGRELAAAVSAAIDGSGLAIDGALSTVFERFTIPLETPPTREEWERRRREGSERDQALAAYFLDRIAQEGRAFDSYEYPLQVVRFGRAVTLIALGGEVVVDYALKLKQALGADRTWVVGYANDVMAYIPTAKILAEGGYEAEGSQVWYGMPSKWDPSIERTILKRAQAAARGE